MSQRSHQVSAATTSERRSKCKPAKKQKFGVFAQKRCFSQDKSGANRLRELINEEQAEEAEKGERSDADTEAAQGVFSKKVDPLKAGDFGRSRQK